MPNDEARMTKEGRNPSDEASGVAAGTFVIRALDIRRSFVIRASTFGFGHSSPGRTVPKTESDRFV